MQTEIANLADQLQVAAPEQRAQVKEQFIAHLRDELDGLVAILSTKEFEAANRIDPASAAYHAVEILQFARYSEAAGLFVQHIDTRSTAFPSVSDEKQAHFPFFPFAVALSALGVPALPALATGGLGADLNTTRFQLCCLVVREILGEELALQHVANLAKDHPPMREIQRIEEAAPDPDANQHLERPVLFRLLAALMRAMLVNSLLRRWRGSLRKAAASDGGC